LLGFLKLKLKVDAALLIFDDGSVLSCYAQDGEISEQALETLEILETDLETMHGPASP
jgi:hypothetical protein